MRKKYTGRIIIAFIIGFLMTMFFSFRMSSSADDEAKSKTKVYNSFQDDALGLLRVQGQLSRGSYRRSVSTASADTSGLGTLEKANQLLETDIVELLETAPDKTKALFAFISEMQRTSDQLLVQEQEMQIKIVEADAKRAECLQQKAVADQLFTQGVNEKNDNIIQSAVADSQKRGGCAEQQRIQYNAYTILKQKMQQTRTLLVDKKNLIENNSDLIIQNFDLFEDRTLMIEQLLEIRERLDAIQSRAKVIQ